MISFDRYCVRHLNIFPDLNWYFFTNWENMWLQEASSCRTQLGTLWKIFSGYFVSSGEISSGSVRFVHLCNIFSLRLLRFLKPEMTTNNFEEAPIINWEVTRIVREMESVVDSCPPRKVRLVYWKSRPLLEWYTF